MGWLMEVAALAAPGRPVSQARTAGITCTAGTLQGTGRLMPEACRSAPGWPDFWVAPSGLGVSGDRKYQPVQPSSFQVAIPRACVHRLRANGCAGAARRRSSED
jgi:hypothetical protein